MAQKKAHEAEAFLKNGRQYPPLALIYGPDKGLVSEYAALFAKNSGVNLGDAFALLKYDGESLEKDPGRLLDEAQTIAFFAGIRLIWLNYSGSGSKNRLTEAIDFLLKNPPRDCFILIEAGDLKKGIFLRKIFEGSAQAMALPCYGDEKQALQKLIDEALAEFECGISEEARAVLQAHLGADRRISRGELEKLCLYAWQSRSIDVEDVKSAVSDGSALAQDDVIDAILCGDIAVFGSKFDRATAGGAPAFLSLSALMRQLRQLQDFRFQMEVQGKSAIAAMASARPPLFFKRRKIIEQALSLWPGQKLARAQQRLQKTLLDSRKNSALATAIIRQNLLALTVEAARSRAR